jgi:hypothetical protein
MTSGLGSRAALLLLAVVTPSAAQQGATASDSGRFKTAHVTYLVGTTAYLDAGRLDGLGDSARVEVVRRGAPVAVLKVGYLSSHRAACDIIAGPTPVAVGDTARFVPVGAQRDSVAAPASGTPQLPRRAASHGLRGRIGAEYLVVGQLGGTGGFSQPALDLRLDGRPSSAPGVSLSLDVRARRTYTILPDGSAVTDGRTRVYQAAVSLGAPSSPTRVTLGRQISGNLASIGVFDGGMFEVNRRAWSMGLFTGAEPEPLQLAFSSAVTQFGAYLQRHSSPGADRRWSLTLGASDSYDNGQANREFAFAQGSYLGRKFVALVTQEVDYYRPWKLMPGMEAVSPTSTFALLRYRVLNALTLDGGFDNRRNVRLYRDVVNPATAFDDAFRQGIWGGLSLQLLGRLRVGVDARSSSGGVAGRAEAYTLSLGAERLTPLRLTLRSRSTRYTGPDLTGWLHSLALSIDPGRVHFELNGGVRQELNPTADPVARVWATWFGADVDLAVARSWYVMLSGTRETGGFEGNDQLYGGISFRF